LELIIFSPINPNYMKRSAYHKKKEKISKTKSNNKNKFTIGKTYKHFPKKRSPSCFALFMLYVKFVLLTQFMGFLLNIYFVSKKFFFEYLPQS